MSMLYYNISLFQKGALLWPYIQDTLGAQERSTYLHHHSSPDDVTHGTKVKIILHFKIKVILVRADGLQEFGDVVGVQCAGLRGHAAGEVRVADMSNSLKEKAYCHKSQAPTPALWALNFLI